MVSLGKDSAYTTHDKFPKELSGIGGVAFPRKFTTCDDAVGLSIPDVALSIAVTHSKRNADTTSTCVGFFTLELVAKTLRLSMDDASTQISLWRVSLV